MDKHVMVQYLPAVDQPGRALSCRMGHNEYLIEAWSLSRDLTSHKRATAKVGSVEMDMR